MRFHAYEYVRMIGHAMNRKHFVPLVLHNSRYVIMQPFLPPTRHQGCPVLNGEDHLDIDLCECVGHTTPSGDVIDDVELLRSSERLFRRRSTNVRPLCGRYGKK